MEKKNINIEKSKTNQRKEQIIINKKSKNVSISINY